MKNAICPNCSSHFFETLYYDLGIVKCKNCDIIYNYNKSSLYESKKYYSQTYMQGAQYIQYTNISAPLSAIHALLERGDDEWFISQARTETNWLMDIFGLAKGKNFWKSALVGGECYLPPSYWVWNLLDTSFPPPTVSLGKN